MDCSSLANIAAKPPVKSLNARYPTCMKSAGLPVASVGALHDYVEAKVDALLLGCTHYPYLARTISDVVGRDVVLVSSADETAFDVLALLHDSDLARDGGPGRHRFLSSGEVTWFRDLGRRLLGPELADVEGVRW